MVVGFGRSECQHTIEIGDVSLRDRPRIAVDLEQSAIRWRNDETHTLAVDRLAIGQDGRHLASTNTTGPLVAIWDVSSGSTTVVIDYLVRLGHLPYLNTIPTGYSEIGGDWIGPSAITTVASVFPPRIVPPSVPSDITSRSSLVAARARILAAGWAQCSPIPVKRTSR